MNNFMALRNNYLPKSVKVVFILESPPAGHGYFYDTTGRVTEVLFRAFMNLLGEKPATKSEGLENLANKGWVLINPIYAPVNKLPDKVADKLILENYENFIADLNFVIGNQKKTPLILIKANIIRLLKEPLLAEGFNVINEEMIPFPLHYHAARFDKATRQLLNRITV